MENIAYAYDNPASVAEPLIVSQWGGAEDVLAGCGEVRINGVRLPLQVVEQLRMAGISAISWLSGSELQDAVDACRYDGNLIDDPNGLSFRDKLTLTSAEQQTRRPRRKPRNREELSREEREKEREQEEECPYLLAL